MNVPVPQLMPDARRRVRTVLERAAQDIEFRELLLSDPQAALRDTDLTNEEKVAVGVMKRVALEEWGIDVRRHRAFLMDNGWKVY
ncbi:Os1348 family NHLP clan protein [Micromonospora sp. NPDC047074]|uniref:Os1348 family NHLP clan protein n=1 Tax=Micromonospora sp. NPDC047074 TaxID=3154339 RepID=UPI0033E5448E